VSWSLRAVAGFCLVLTACHQATQRSDAPVVATRADSLVLERTRCFGACPAYRLRLRADGHVAFTSLVPRDSGLTFVDSMAPEKFTWLVQRADRIGIAKLPPVVAQDTLLCAVRGTDHPTVTVSLFRPGAVTRVEDYRGCYAGSNLAVVGALARLRTFTGQIDSVARTSRWTAHVTRQ